MAFDGGVVMVCSQGRRVRRRRPGSGETDVERLVHIGGPDRPKWLAILAFSLSNSILDILTLAKQGIATLGITAVKSHPIRRPFRVIRYRTAIIGVIDDFEN